MVRARDGPGNGDPAGGPGLFYEDFEVNAVYETAARTVTAEDVQAFADLTGDHNPLHTDEEFARQTPYGERIAHGLLGLSIVVGLFEDVGIFRGTALAFLGIQEWRFEGPIMFGDELRARMTVIDKRRSRSDSARGIITRRYELLNQHDEILQRGDTTVLVRARTGTAT